MEHRPDNPVRALRILTSDGVLRLPEQPDRGECVGFPGCAMPELPYAAGMRTSGRIAMDVTDALSEGIDVNTKKRVLSDEFGISMTETIERTVDNMCNLSYGIAERAAKEAAEKSKKETLYGLVHDEIIALSEGAKRAGLTEPEFKAGMEAYYAQLASA